MGANTYSEGDYTVDFLYEVTQPDQPDNLDKQAQGWSNAAEIYRLEYENLNKHYEAIKGSWTSEAGNAYMEVVLRTLDMIGNTRTVAENKAEALATIAENVRYQQQDVKQEYEDWQKELAKAEAEAEASDPFKLENWLNPGTNVQTNVRAWGFGESPTDSQSLEERRRPFDERARAHMDSALERYIEKQPAIIQPMPNYRPIEDAGNGILPGEEPGWGSDGASGSYATNTAGFSAASYGGNASGPALQNAANATPTPAAPTGPTGGAPPGPSMGGGPVGGIPPGGVSQVGRTPTPPAKPLSPNTNRAPGTRPPGTGAQRTPGLPGNRGNGNMGRPGAGPGRGGANPSRPGAGGGRTAPGANGRPGAGRGLQKSRYAPQDRTGRVRASGEVMGRRASTAKQQAEAAKNQPKSPQRRVVSRPVISGSKTSRPTGKDSSLRGPKDRTGQGYTKQVIGGRNTQFSRTPLVGKRLDPTAGQHILGKKIVETEESRKQKMLDDRMTRRRKIQQNNDGLSRPVIDNGITNSAQLDNAEPSKEETVKAEDSFWQLDDQQVTRGVIGQPRPMPEATHDPGPGVITGRGSAEPAAEERPGSNDPGPTAFGRQRPDTTNWP